MAAFAGCQITGKTGTYTLTATSAGLTSATSGSLSITIGAPSKLAFTAQPGGGANAAAWSAQPVVTIQDVGGNTVTTATNSITLSIGTNPGGTLACTTNPLGATVGTSSFAGCKITGKTGSYTLTAAATGLTGATSSAFTITPGTATQLVYSTQPGGGGDGSVWSAQPAVSIEDVSGNAGDHCHQLDHPGYRDQPRRHAGLHRQPQDATGGVATFAGCEITGTLGNYTLTASATGLTSATSNNIPITAGAPSKLAFTTQPGGGANAAVWTGQPAVTIEDAGGNTVTTATNSITLAIGTNPGGTLACTTNPLGATGARPPSPAARSPARRARYTLTATATGSRATTSAAFTITAGAATQLVFTTQPGGGTNGTAWSAQPAVAVEDAIGNVVTTATNSITLALGTNPGGALACTTNPLGASGGTSSFAGCKITGKAGSYTLTAAATGLTGATSAAFNITAGTATQLVYSTQPGGGADGADLGHPARRQHRGRVGQRGDHRHQLDHLGHRDQPGRHAGLHRQPQERHGRRCHLRRL